MIVYRRIELSKLDLRCFNDKTENVFRNTLVAFPKCCKIYWFLVRNNFHEKFEIHGHNGHC